MMTLGERIRNLRKSKGMSQEAVASALGVSRQAVTRWENGRSDPSTANLIELAKLFGISIGELCGTADSVQPDLQQLAALLTHEQQQRTLRRKRRIRTNLIAAGSIFLGYAALYFIVRLIFVPVCGYSVMGWLFGNEAAREAGYLYGWLCQQGIFLSSCLLSVLAMLLGRYRLGLISFLGFTAGLILGELLGPNPTGAAYGNSHYGWVIWGLTFLISLLAGIGMEFFCKKHKQ